MKSRLISSVYFKEYVLQVINVDNSTIIKNEFVRLNKVIKFFVNANRYEKTKTKKKFHKDFYEVPNVMLSNPIKWAIHIRPELKIFVNSLIWGELRNANFHTEHDGLRKKSVPLWAEIVILPRSRLVNTNVIVWGIVERVSVSTIEWSVMKLDLAHLGWVRRLNIIL